MKKIIKIFIVIVISLCLLTIVGCNEEIKPLDEIDYYEIKIDPRADGTLDMHFMIVWRVLDDKSEGPLEWVKIGIPNYHVDEIKPLSDNIRNIEYYSEDGAFIRLDFKNKYYQGDLVKFEFSTHQSYMYTFDEYYCYFEYTPGWFEEIKVKEIKILWNNSNVLNSNANQKEDNYLIWNYTLDFGEKVQVYLRYDINYFQSLNTKMQYTDRYTTPQDIIIVIVIIAVVVGIVGLSIYFTKKSQDPYMKYRGFCGHRIRYYTGYPHYYYNYGVDRHGKRIANPNTSGLHSSGSGGHSCACACACACAGGGRAGCSRKDFYKTNLKVDQINRALEK